MTINTKIKEKLNNSLLLLKNRTRAKGFGAPAHSLMSGSAIFPLTHISPAHIRKKH